MATVLEQIRSVDEAVTGNIEALAGDRSLLSQNLIAQLRNLVECVAVRLETGSDDAHFDYSEVGGALAHVRANAKLNFLGRFHKLIQISASHYTVDGDSSERLMLKYYAYLLRLRALLRDTCGIEVLGNLEAFPVDLDPSLREYYEKIAARIDAVRGTPADGDLVRRYYIHKVRPFFVDGRILYEVTFFNAVNKVSKFDRIIGFTDIEVTDNYAASLTLASDSIEVLGQTMPITIIRNWEISIRPCEFDNFARYFGLVTDVRAGTTEYRYLMQALTRGHATLIDVVDLPKAAYEQMKAAATARVSKPQIFPTLDLARKIVRNKSAGHNTIRYLMLRLYNQVLKPQYSTEPCALLSRLKLQWGCVPFETMPFCTSLIYHNPRIIDLLEALDPTDRTHELLARRVKNNVEREAILYTPKSEVEGLGDVDDLVGKYNGQLYYKHRKAREMLQDMGQLFIRQYEDDTVAIIEMLQELATSGIDGYKAAVDRWLNETAYGIDDELKRDALRKLFAKSRVALVYGAAGTGKSTMVNHVANHFNDKRKLFLAQTNPAVDNLKRRVTAQNSTFRTIASQMYRTTADPAFDVLVIDECSTVSNADLLRVLEKTDFKLLVLVGDVYQIEAIQFGNWFGVVRSFIPPESVFELTNPYRTKNDALLGFWDKVRNIDDDIVEVIARNGYSTVLDSSLFEAQRDDEIILCLNYDGLYGINNINRFLQSSNEGEGVVWGVTTYKVGDPVLFNETERFRPVIYNNLKGRIAGIHAAPGQVTFDVELDRVISEFDVQGQDLEWLGDSTVRFDVYEHANSDADDDSVNTSVPFQVAYAVSIHKAQGLEYDSVKVVITDANEDDISHSVFYTAITRARERLLIFWTPETEHAVLAKLRRDSNAKDVAILTQRRSLTQVGGA